MQVKSYLLCFGFSLDCFLMRYLFQLTFTPSYTLNTIDNRCGTGLFMGVLDQGVDLASYLDVTDLFNFSMVNSKCYQATKKCKLFVDVKRVIFDLIGTCGVSENDSLPSFARVCRIYQQVEQDTVATLRRLQSLYLSPLLECLDEDINQLIDQSMKERYIAEDEPNGKCI